VLYTMPTVHNPTGVSQPLERRQEIARLVREHEVRVVEDDCYRFLHDEPPPPIASLAPERTWYLTSFSKDLGAGLRVGLLLVPDERGDGRPSGVDAVVAASSGVGWLCTPSMGELVTRWIDDGTAERVGAEKRAEARARRALADRMLGAHGSPSIETSCHLWLPLPEPRRPDDFVHRLRERGVAVTPPGPFAVGRAAAPHAVRVCLSTPRSRSDLERGLDGIARELHTACVAGGSVL
jgi:DNA-binding transcriptional MocR family regulator